MRRHPTGNVIGTERYSRVVSDGLTTRHQQGAVVGLRQTGQRLGAILVPPVMGAIADRFGAGPGFLIYAALMLPPCGLLALIDRGRRRPAGGDA